MLRARVLPPARWYLGFDCATKTFAFSLSRVDLSGAAAIRARALACQELLRRPASEESAARLEAAVAALDRESRDMVRLVDGETVDLFPGRADADIPTVERVRAVVAYVRARVLPALAIAENPCVIVEFQMGPNARARVVSAALVTLFADMEVIIVGPSLKNKVHADEQGMYCHFAKKYARSYDANKAHAKYNFARIEQLFGTEIPAMRPAALRGHIADSFMQVLGHLRYGHEENAEAMF